MLCLWGGHQGDYYQQTHTKAYSEAHKEANEEAPKTSLVTIKQRLAARNTRPDGPEDLSWADDGSLSTLSRDHRCEGMLAFGTCNANA